MFLACKPLLSELKTALLSNICFEIVDLREKDKMKKQLLTAGITLALFTVLLSGCVNESSSPVENNLVSFKELNDHLAKYIGQKITIEGYIGEGFGKYLGTPYVTNFCDSSSNTPQYCVLLTIPSNITIYRGMYRIIGMVGEHNVTSIPMIDVTSAEAL